MSDSGSPFHSPFESGGRRYGGCGSWPTTPTDPPSSTSRMPLQAPSAVRPPPTIRYRKLGMVPPVLEARGSPFPRARSPNPVPPSPGAVCSPPTLALEEARMMMLALHRTPTLTRERYEEVVRHLTGGKARIESAADLPFEGLLVHATGEGPDGFVVFDVFESEASVEAFRTAVGSIPREVGIEEPPVFFPAHTVFIA